MDRLLKITAETTMVVVDTQEGPVEIIRAHNDMQLIDGILQPMVPLPSVQPVAELEVLDALRNKDYRVVDMRERKWRLKATIPGSISIPFNEVTERMDELGCTKKPSGWECADALNVVAFCNGPACPQSPTAIRAMVQHGFPPARIHYYRGGMQDWLVLGLTSIAIPA